jgi:hypothetical protein
MECAPKVALQLGYQDTGGSQYRAGQTGRQDKAGFPSLIGADYRHYRDWERGAEEDQRQGFSSAACYQYIATCSKNISISAKALSFLTYLTATRIIFKLVP